MPRKKTNKIYLDESLKKTLHDNARKRNLPERVKLRSRILLMADENAPGGSLSDREISERLGTSPKTVGRLRTRVANEGNVLDALFDRARSRHRPRKLDDAGEQKLLELAKSKPPEGIRKWSLRSLAQEMARRGHVDEVAHETVRRVLKRHNAVIKKYHGL